MSSVGDAFAWPFQDPGWFGKMILQGLIAIIPIIGWIAMAGWMMAPPSRDSLAIPLLVKGGYPANQAAGSELGRHAATVAPEVAVWVLLPGQTVTVPAATDQSAAAQR